MTPQLPVQFQIVLPSASDMGGSLRFLSRFFNLLMKTKGNGKSEKNEVNGKKARLRNPAALPEEILSQFSLADIKAATNNFHEDLILGRGYHGPVYKGFFHDGNLVFAIKRWNSESQEGRPEFQTEVQLLCQLRHQHLASLIGLCKDKGEVIFVYEYMRNGALHNHLYGCGYDPLPWKQRLEICIAAARGLHYLHSGAKQAVIHRNIKSTNILLDDRWVCKLGDFGLSKMRPRSKSTKALEKINSEVRGSFGYLDPEYARTRGVTEKSDVYSFGVVLFEVLCARPVIDFSVEKNQVNLVTCARLSIRAGTIYNIIDPYLKGRIAPECFKIFVDIAYSCTYDKGNGRPEMGEVEVMLERALELQEKADSDMLHLAPNGEYMYEDESFCAIYSDHISDVESDMDSSSSFNHTK